jgi:hypothetical protein
MSDVTTTIKSSDLDFDTIKTSLKNYLKTKSEFNDYNFEASGLSNVLDVLAYNTHLNGLIANMSVNESFLSTAQLRASVVSLAEAIGYNPRSTTSSQATVKLTSIVSDIERPDSITLPRGRTFSTSVDGVTYTFRTLNTYSAVDDGSGNYFYKDENDSDELLIYEGIEKTKTFYVGEVSDNQVYVIPDTTIDTSTMVVKVFPSASSDEADAEEYYSLSTATRITENSTFYQVKEVPNGFYELIFGDGITTGKAPQSGNKIVVTYLSSKGAAANGASVFESTSTVTVDGFGTYNITISTVNASGAGDSKEAIDVIRQNAPVAFASQQRLVTAEDYTSQILKKYSSVLQDVFSWGGADNVPPVYGRVYVALKFKDNVSEDVQQSTKDGIVSNITDNFAVMSVDTEFTDPVSTFLEVAVNFNYNPDLTSSTPRALQNTVEDYVVEFFNENLNKFGKVFRKSALVSEIDDLSTAILDSRMTVKVQQRITPLVGNKLGYIATFPVSLASPDDERHIITTGTFVFNNKTCIIRNKLSSNKLEIFSVGDRVELDNVGNYSVDGTVTIEGFNPVSISGGSQLKITATPANDATIKPLRNYVLSLDKELLSSTASADYQEGEGI